MGTFDGPGLRLVVFMQGCNFKCIYCANPDTIAIGKGREVSCEEVIKHAVDSKAFFGRRGGITFSGGEPTLQAHKLLPLFKKLKEENIHICLDTNGSIFNDDVRELFNYTDMVLLDVKAANQGRHQVIAKYSNEQVLKTAHYLESLKIPIRLRCVMIPGYNDSPEDIRAIGERYGSFTNIDRVEVLPYHTYGVHKYESLGWKYPLEGLEEHTEEQVAAVTEEFKKYFPNVWTQ